VLVFNRSKDRREGVRLRVDAATLGLTLVPGQTLAATDHRGRECKAELPLDRQPEGAAGIMTHDYCLLLVAPF
jgi:hypothetical protein